MSDHIDSLPALAQLRRCPFTPEQALIVQAVFLQAESLAVVVHRAMQALATALVHGESPAQVCRELEMLAATAGDLKQWLCIAGANVAMEREQEPIVLLH
jgi:hypothetical protein